MLSTSPLGTCPWDALSTWSYSPPEVWRERGALPQPFTSRSD